PFRSLLAVIGEKSTADARLPQYPPRLGLADALVPSELAEGERLVVERRVSGTGGSLREPLAGSPNRYPHVHPLGRERLTDGLACGLRDQLQEPAGGVNRRRVVHDPVHPGGDDAAGRRDEAVPAARVESRPDPARAVPDLPAVVRPPPQQVSA